MKTAIALTPDQQSMLAITPDDMFAFPEIGNDEMKLILCSLAKLKLVKKSRPQPMLIAGKVIVRVGFMRTAKGRNWIEANEAAK